MNCRSVEKQLALLAGGDLPEKKSIKLQAHIDNCRSCAAELERFKHSRELLEELKKVDIPTPLGEGFSRRVLLNILEQKKSGRRSAPDFSSLFRWKPALVFSGAALIVMLAIKVNGELQKSRWEFLAEKGSAASGQAMEVKSGEVAWSAKFALIRDLIGPAPPNEVDFPDQPGIYAVLCKPDPVNRPRVFTVNFIGEESELSSLRENLVTIGRGEVMMSRASSGDSLYIVLYPMPESSAEERVKLKDSLIDRYKPLKSSNGGI